MIHDRASTTTRERTPNGMLRAKAVLTRAGEFSYDAADIGVGKRGERITVERTEDTLADPKTLASLRGAPITIDHPESFVSPENFRSLAVGHVVGEPQVEDGRLVADVLIADKDAIEALETGKREISLGYNQGFMLQSQSNDRYSTQGGMEINHVALVTKGRSGPSVRVLDGGETMEAKELQDAIKSAITDALPKRSSDSTADAIAKALEPVLAKVQDIADSQAREKREEAQAAAAEKAKAAADKLIKDTADRVRAEERSRFEVLADAAKILPPEKLDALKEGDTKGIIEACVSDVFPEPEKIDEAVLRGALAAKAKMSTPEVTDSSVGPAVRGYNHVNDPDAPSAPYMEYVKELTEAWEEEAA